jgi:hypothetical protein
LGGFGVSLDDGTSQQAREQKKAKRSGQAERSGEGGFGVSPDFNTTRNANVQKSLAQRPGRSQRRRGVRGLPRLRQTQLARTLKKAKPNAAARLKAAEKGGSGVTTATAIQLVCTPKKAKPIEAARPSVAEKKCSKVSPDYGNPTRTHADEGLAERICQAEGSGE